MCLGKYLTHKNSHPNAIVIFTVVPCIVRLCSRDCASRVIGATLFRAKRENDYDRSDKKGLALFPPPPVRMLVLTLTLLKLLAHGQVSSIYTKPDGGYIEICSCLRKEVHCYCVATNIGQ